jgi:AcrR family transcriptional regulator
MKATAKVKSTPKMSSEDRRAAIVKAVRQVFAEKGFYGTTTRALAEAAGVSEALLFKHFPNKEALFSAMQLSCLDEEDQERLERLMSLEPSASTVVLMVHFMMSRFIGRCASRDDDHTIHHRLMLRSLAENGDFARHILQQKAAGWIEKFDEGMEAAVAAGEAHPGPVRPRLGGWFVHHLAAMTMTYLLPDKPVVDYGIARDKLVEQLVWFALRGMGLKEDAIKRHYNPRALALFAE